MNLRKFWFIEVMVWSFLGGCAGDLKVDFIPVLFYAQPDRPNWVRALAILTIADVKSIPIRGVPDLFSLVVIDCSK